MKIGTAIKSAALLVFLTASVPAVSGLEAFLVDMKIIQDGVELATPRMIVQEGAEASMSLTGENPVAIGLIVNRAGEGEAHVLAEIETDSGQISPEFLMLKDQWTSISKGNLEFHINVQDHVANQ